MSLQGADLSRYQGRVNWDQAKTKLQFAIDQAGGYGSVADSTYGYNARGADRVGVVHGAYYFADPRQGPPDPQVDHFLSLAPAAPFYAMDLEVASAATQDLTSWADEFMARLASRTRKLPWAYSYSPFWRAHYHGGGLLQYPLWLAAYTASEPPPPPPWHQVAVWQNTDKLAVPGISGAVDGDIFNGDMAALLALIGGSDMTPEEVQAQIDKSLQSRDAQITACNWRILELVYAQELGRTVDSAGFNYWVPVMTSKSWEEFITALRASDEAKHYRATGQPDFTPPHDQTVQQGQPPAGRWMQTFAHSHDFTSSGTSGPPKT